MTVSGVGDESGPNVFVGGPLKQRVRHLASAVRRRKGEEVAFIVSNAVVNLANFGFFIAVGRLFDPSVYGAISALLSIVTVANTPLNAIQAGVVNATVAAGEAFNNSSLRRITVAFTLVGLATTIVLGAASPLFEHFFSLPSVFAPLVLALWFAPSVINSALCGSLMGRFQFRAVAEANVVGALVRLTLVLVFGFAGHFLGLVGPVLATSIGITVTTGWVFQAVRREPAWRGTMHLKLHLSQTFWAFVALGGFATFTAIDVILARHFLLPTTAGNYAVAATAGKIALFLSVAVPIVVYPRFAAQRESGSHDRHFLLLSFAVVLLLGIAAAAVMTVAPHLVIDVLFGHRYAPAAATLRILAPAGAVMGAVGLFTYFHVAHRSVVAAVPWIGVVVVVVVMRLSNLGARGLAWMMLFTSIGVCVAMAVPAFALRSKEPR